MMDGRVPQGVVRGRGFEMTVDGEKITAYEGETVAAALLAAGRLTLRHTAKNDQPRGMYCGIGLCHECLMEIDGIPNTRACQTLATPGCRVNSQQGWGKGRE
ncbi:MAG: (2Fe-2S)-binding protein [Thermodesulfobacteriota bacterium]